MGLNDAEPDHHPRTRVAERPYVLLSAAVSLDGHIDDSSPDRLILSGEEDLDRVDEVRSGVDAILVGAGTVRTDDPRLVVRSPLRRRQRLERGQPEQPLKVTITESGNLDACSRFFTTGTGQRIVYTREDRVPALSDRLGALATVVGLSGPQSNGEPDRSEQVAGILGDLASRGVRRLMVEGGGCIHAMFLRAGVVDELQLVVAPLVLADPTAPRFLGSAPMEAGRVRPGSTRRLRLRETRRLGDCVLVRYDVGRR